MSRTDAVEINDLILTFSGDDWLGLSQAERVARRWRIEVLRTIWSDDDDSGGEEQIVIGRGSATVIDIDDAADAGVPVWDVFDMISSETEHLYGVYDEADGWWDEDLGLAVVSSTALFLETLSLDPPYRGLGLGPPILAGIIDRLASGCSFAALEPHPFGEPFGGKTIEEATRSLERLWGGLGFEPFRNGVWVLDLGTTVFSARRKEIFGR